MIEYHSHSITIMFYNLIRKILKVKCEEEVNGQKEREGKRGTTHLDVHPHLYMHKAPVSRIGVSVNHRLNRKLK